MIAAQRYKVVVFCLHETFEKKHFFFSLETSVYLVVEPLVDQRLKMN